ncbi:MAG: hypothetical protein HOI23_13315 [Deltaproteobacteria bacterium]|nr:hypothetical protein [Deltaproteobacteria bacterium]
MTDKIKSKVLVYEPDPKQQQFLRVFCEKNHLMGLRVDNLERFIRTLNSELDLGALFLCEQEGDEDKTKLRRVVRALSSLRPELPVFLRRIVTSDGVEEDWAERIAGSYYGEDDETIRELIDTYIFNRYYPTEVIRQIQNDTQKSLENLFLGFTVGVDFPHLTRDRILYGEVLTLMRLESNWCRGYMMIEVCEAPIHELLVHGAIPGMAQIERGADDFRSVNAVLSELTNAVWGRIKAAMLDAQGDNTPGYQAEIPSIINNNHNFITFGTDDPNLCFRYVMLDPEEKVEPFMIQQRFVFHLKWKPEAREESQLVDRLVDSGEITFL